MQIIHLLHETRRDLCEKHGHNEKDCAIGYFENTVKMASDSGAIEYKINPNTISRHHYGCPSRLIETIDIVTWPKFTKLKGS